MNTTQNPEFNWTPKKTEDTPKRSIAITDSIVDSIIDKFVERATFGKAKYNRSISRGLARTFNTRKIGRYSIHAKSTSNIA